MIGVHALMLVFMGRFHSGAHKRLGGLKGLGKLPEL